MYYGTAVIALALVGLVITTYLRDRQLRKKKVKCFFGEDCGGVLESKYNHFFGAPNVVLGKYFYILTIFAAFLIIYYAKSFPLIGVGLVLASGLAMFVSLYLTYVQAFLLRKWCAWCLATGIVNILLFLASYRWIFM